MGLGCFPCWVELTVRNPRQSILANSMHKKEKGILGKDAFSP